LLPYFSSNCTIVNTCSSTVFCYIVPICIVNVFFALGAILGRAVAFASPVTLVTTATDLVLCTLTVEIAETCAIAKTMPFVTQPTESALAHRDSWAKNAIENVRKDSMAKDANTSADAKMEQSMYSLPFDFYSESV